MEYLTEYNSLFPDFAFIKLIGKGSYGDVYYCTRKSDGIKVALKIIRNAEGSDDGMSISTLREIMFMRYCHHPNIVRILDVISPDLSFVSHSEGLPPIAIVMEYIDYDLLGLIKSANMGNIPWLSIDAIRWLSYQLFLSLNYLHNHQIIHRDIKPANLLITSNCDLKLSDFGLSRRIGNVFQTSYTNRVITLWYRPPELILGSTYYGPEVDIWSAGCILGELLSGTSLFTNFNDDDFLQLQLIFYHCGFPNDSFLQSLSQERHFEFEDHPRDLRQYIVDTARKVKGKQFTHIPEEALDLIDLILQPSPSRRPNAATILQHPFFHGLDSICFSFPSFADEGCHDLEVKTKIARITTTSVGEVQLVKERAVQSNLLLNHRYDTLMKRSASSFPDSGIGHPANMEKRMHF